uniref:Imm1 family immunity protein n=2 Tax=Actinokineospora enzanensis TaxID=155975 RepID=UPI00047552A7
VPTIGTNSDWVTYHFGGAEETGLPPFSEVPIDTVYQVLTEFIVTRTRPTCVDWREAAPFESQFG